MEKQTIYDVDAIRKGAAEYPGRGAVTQDYPLDREQACAYLNTALATEIMCALRYRGHQFVARGIHYLPIADEFREHAEQEEKHMLMIAERINQLGGIPNFAPSYVAKNALTDYGNNTDLMAMVREDLIGERIVIDVYRKMISWFGADDPTTRRMLENILEDEEDHANELADLLADSNHEKESTIRIVSH